MYSKRIADVAGRPENDFLPFYGHWVKSEVGSTCLSQWYPAPISVSYKGEQLKLATAEHFMMFTKCLTFLSKDKANEEILQRIIQSTDPKDVKGLGRQIKGFDEPTWDARKFQFVVQGNKLKFTQNPELGKFLKSTGNLVLVEASPYDRIWGIGLDKNDRDVARPSKWRGENLLGFALMEVRDNHLS